MEHQAAAVPPADSPPAAPPPPSSPPDYGGFWIRLGAYLLDALMFLPLSMVMMWLMNHRSLYTFAQIPGLAISIAFHVLCVQRWGGTPGKLISGLRIVREDLKPAEAKEAWLRFAPQLTINVAFMIVYLAAAAQLSVDEYRSLDFLARGRRISELGGTTMTVMNWLLQIWTWSEFIVLLTNPKRRALHDFIAGTVVIRVPRAASR